MLLSACTPKQTGAEATHTLSIYGQYKVTKQADKIVGGCPSQYFFCISFFVPVNYKFDYHFTRLCYHQVSIK